MAYDGHEYFAVRSSLRVGTRWSVTSFSTCNGLHVTTQSLRPTLAARQTYQTIHILQLFILLAMYRSSIYKGILYANFLEIYVSKYHALHI